MARHPGVPGAAHLSTVTVSFSLLCFLMAQQLRRTLHKLKITVNLKCIVSEIQPISYREQERLAEVGAKSSREAGLQAWAQRSSRYISSGAMERAFATAPLRIFSCFSFFFGKLFTSTVQKWQALKLHPKLQVMGASFPMRILKPFIASYCKCQDKRARWSGQRSKELIAELI